MPWPPRSVSAKPGPWDVVSVGEEDVAVRVGLGAGRGPTSPFTRKATLRVERFGPD
jgi:hypothetical protein